MADRFKKKQKPKQPAFFLLRGRTFNREACSSASRSVFTPVTLGLLPRRDWLKQT